MCGVRGLALPCGSETLYYAAGGALHAAPVDDASSAAVVAHGFGELYSIASTTDDGFLVADYGAGAIYNVDVATGDYTKVTF
jgi:hypothetical protein